MRRHVNEQILSAVATVTFLASIQTNAKHNSDRLACATPLPGSRGARLKPPMDTDFYAWGHETNQNSGMPGTKAKTSSGVLSPKMASGAISEHQQIRVGA